MVENIFHQKRWKNFSIKNDGKYFPVENVFRKADEFSLSANIQFWEMYTIFENDEKKSVICDPP